jgi:hypothetical protein
MYIVAIITSFAGTESFAVMPVERPTVAKADTTSNKI